MVTGSGTLLDIACGTGQLAFALHARFARTWAVDQEPDMIAVVREKGRTDLTWTADAIAGFALSTSVMSAMALGDQAGRSRPSCAANCSPAPPRAAPPVRADLPP